jgi:Arc/MetJ-type ribon-helix-helix transcriptional regulator
MRSATQAVRPAFPALRYRVIPATGVVAVFRVSLYGDCMARMISTTVRLSKEDVRALRRARAAGHSASELVRKGLRVVASRYYTGRRPPSTLLFESTDAKLGEESELFRDLED